MLLPRSAWIVSCLAGTCSALIVAGEELLGEAG